MCGSTINSLWVLAFETGSLRMWPIGPYGPDWQGPFARAADVFAASSCGSKRHTGNVGRRLSRWPKPKPSSLHESQGDSLAAGLRFTSTHPHLRVDGARS